MALTRTNHDHGIMECTQIGGALPATATQTTSFAIPCRISRVSISYSVVAARDTVVSILRGASRFEISRVSASTAQKIEVRDGAPLVPGEEIEVTTTGAAGTWDVACVATIGGNI